VSEYRFSRLCFRRDVIEPLAESASFRVVTPVGTFEMTKGEFYETFANVPKTRSYREIGLYHYPTLPSKALRFKVRS
jgi:hypothetical protein